MPDGKMPAKEGVDDDNDKARATRSMPRLDDTIDVALDKPMRLRKGR